RRRRANEFRLDDDGDLVADPQVAARRRDAVGDTEVAPTQHAMSGEAHAGLGIHRMAKITAVVPRIEHDWLGDATQGQLTVHAQGIVAEILDLRGAKG